MLVKITKIGVAPNAEIAPADWASMVPGKNPPAGKALPVDYEFEGTLLAPIVLGQQVIALRHDRNGVPALGLICSTAVEEIVLVTRNCVYRLRALEKPDPCATK